MASTETPKKNLIRPPLSHLEERENKLDTLQVSFLGLSEPARLLEHFSEVSLGNERLEGVRWR